MNVLSDLALAFWRLLPGNPIMVRVVAAASKRVKHLWARIAYLAVLIMVVLFQGGLAGYDASLAESAKKATQVFLVVSVAQLALMSFIAPIFCAGAITQEKDSNTFSILLTTPLSTAQIVLGSLFSRIYFIWALLLSGLPIFCITMIFGGVTQAEVFQSFGLSACTALLTGSIAITISFLKVGTRRTIFYFFVGIAVYLLLIGAIGQSTYGQLAEAKPGDVAFGLGTGLKMSWLAPIHPFLALLVVTGQTPAPPLSDVMRYGWPWARLLAYPEYGYMILTTLASIAMVLFSMVMVRRGEQEGEPTLVGRVSKPFRVATIGEPPPRKPRRVWSNPIAWREAATRGSASGGPMVRWAIFVIGAAAALLLLTAYHASWWPALTTNTVASWLTVVAWVELLVVLLIVTTTAASTLTRERESQTMEILLTTPLTSKYVMAGMLQGLVRYVTPLIAIPALTLLIFVLADLVRGRTPCVPPESVVIVPGLMIAFASTAALAGLQCSLSYKKTVQAVMISASLVLGVASGLWLCGAAVKSGNVGLTFSSVVFPFLPFPSLQALIDPGTLENTSANTIGGATISKGEIAAARLTRIVCSMLAIGAYALITWALYQNLVKNFDQTIRRQST